MKKYKFDWYGSCVPKPLYTRTFSVGVFQWIPKKNGNGLKRSRALKRIHGYSSQPQKIYDEADQLCREWQEKFGYSLHPELREG